MQALFTEAWSPHVVLSLTFRLNSHLENGGSSSLLILPGLLRSDWAGLSVSPLLRENGRMPAAYVGDTNSLSWNFISFPHKPSYSASFLHWIFSLSYPYLTTLYIFNSIISWLPKPSPLKNPWIHWGWTPVAQDFYIISTLKWSVYILSPLPPHVEKAIATHSSTLAWKIPWTEEPGKLQSMGSLRVGHNWATSAIRIR